MEKWKTVFVFDAKTVRIILFLFTFVILVIILKLRPETIEYIIIQLINKIPTMEIKSH